MHALNNWTVKLRPDGQVTLTSWEREQNAALIKNFVVAKPEQEGDKTESVGKGVQGKKAVYRRYDFVLPACSIKPTEGTGGWATSVADGKTRITLTLGMHNRAQNPNYPQDIQSSEQINAIIGSVGADAGKKKKPKAAPKPDEVQADVESDEEK